MLQAIEGNTYTGSFWGGSLQSRWRTGPLPASPAPCYTESMQDEAVFEAYKPLRNHLRKLCLADSLAVIRAYVQYLQLDTPIPRDCEVHRNFAFAASKSNKVALISEWELETLCREVILNAQDGTYCPETLKKWSCLARAINKLKELEDSIGEKFVSPDNILLELHRTAHRQFPWQSAPPNKFVITRYFKIYSHPPLERIICEEVGMGINDLFIVGLALLGTYLDKFALFYPPRIDIPGLTLEAAEKFLAHFAIDLSQLKQRLHAEQEMNDKFAYAYNSLRAYPLIRMTYNKKDSLICPLPTLLFWRFTNGVYYEICTNKAFADAFGEAFQIYVGDVLRQAIDASRTKFYPEEEYWVGKNKKRTADWIVEQDDAILFIEVKTKRLVVLAKIEIDSEDALKNELRKMADFVIQVYKAIKDYRADQYPTFRFKHGRRIFPLIVTLEDWFLIGPKLLSGLSAMVEQGFNEAELPLEWLKEMPYSICSIQEFEEAIQVMQVVGIKEFMEKKLFDDGKREWAFGVFLRSEFPEAAKSVRFLFPDDFKGLGVPSTK